MDTKILTPGVVFGCIINQNDCQVEERNGEWNEKSENAVELLIAILS